MIERPLPNYRFLVTFDPADAHLPIAQAAMLILVAAAGFQQVTGLGAELEVMSYAEGGVNDRVRQLPVRHTFNRITFHRGVIRDPGLFWWYQVGLHDSLGARRDGAIILLTPMGLPAMAWIFRGALAAKWVGPTLHGSDGAVVLAGEVVEVGGSGGQEDELVGRGLSPTQALSDVIESRPIAWRSHCPR